MPHQHQHEDTSPLDRYGRDLTSLARQGAFAPLAGHDGRIARVFAILLRNRSETGSSRTKCNPAILDLDGTQSWPLAGEAIRRMASDDAPAPLRDCRVVALDWEALLAEVPNIEELRQPFARRFTSYPLADLAANPALFDEFLQKWSESIARCEANLLYQRLKAVFAAAHHAQGRVLLFVEHFHRLLGGEWERYPVDVAPLLKPALARGEIQLLTTCPLDSYRRDVERDAAFQRRFQEVCMPDVLPHRGHLTLTSPNS
jgi:ATP-dependent Clp protease ATP-binding subunit ClpB